MFYDVWNYNGEPIADARIDYLAPAVGKFVVVEGRHTFTGRRKDRLFVEDAPFRNRPDVEIVVVDEYVSGGAWANETFQRNAGGLAFKRIAGADDVGVFSDADEIPELPFFSMAERAFKDGAPALWYEQAFFYYNFGWAKASRWPPHGGAAPYGFIAGVPTQSFRTAGRKQAVSSGWHASYFETPERISDKIKSFSHTEYDRPDFTDTAKIRDRIYRGADLFDRVGEDCRPVSIILPEILSRFNEKLVASQAR